MRVNLIFLHCAECNDYSGNNVINTSKSIVNFCFKRLPIRDFTTLYKFKSGIMLFQPNNNYSTRNYTLYNLIYFEVKPNQRSYCWRMEQPPK